MAAAAPVSSSVSYCLVVSRDGFTEGILPGITSSAQQMSAESNIQVVGSGRDGLGSQHSLWFLKQPKQPRALIFDYSIAWEVCALQLFRFVGNPVDGRLVYEISHYDRNKVYYVASSMVVGFQTLCQVFTAFLPEPSGQKLDSLERLPRFFNSLFDLHEDNRQLLADFEVMGRVLGDQDVHLRNIGIDRERRLVRLDMGSVTLGKKVQEELPYFEHTPRMEKLCASDFTTNLLWPEFYVPRRWFVWDMAVLLHKISYPATMLESFLYREDIRDKLREVTNDEKFQRCIFKALLRQLLLPDIVGKVLSEALRSETLRRYPYGKSATLLAEEYADRIKRLHQEFLDPQGDGFGWFKTHWEKYGAAKIVTEVSDELGKSIRKHELFAASWDKYERMFNTQLHANYEQVKCAMQKKPTIVLATKIAEEEKDRLRAEAKEMVRSTFLGFLKSQEMRLRGIYRYKVGGQTIYDLLQSKRNLIGAAEAALINPDYTLERYVELSREIEKSCTFYQSVAATPGFITYVLTPECSHRDQAMRLLRLEVEDLGKCQKYLVQERREYNDMVVELSDQFASVTEFGDVFRLKALQEEIQNKNFALIAADLGKLHTGLSNYIQSFAPDMRFGKLVEILSAPDFQWAPLPAVITDADAEINRRKDLIDHLLRLTIFVACQPKKTSLTLFAKVPKMSQVSRSLLRGNQQIITRLQMVFGKGYLSYLSLDFDCTVKGLLTGVSDEWQRKVGVPVVVPAPKNDDGAPAAAAGV